MATMHVTIKGTVQGVFYRATAKSIADQIGITGWIKNTPDGDVEAMIQGTDEQVDAFIQWCWKGPEKAKVSDVILKTVDAENFTEFKVIRGV